MKNFEEIYNQVKDINGWMSKEDCEVIYNYTKNIKGLFVEIGSYMGISTKTMALSSPESEIIAIDSYLSLNPPDPKIDFVTAKKTFLEATKDLHVTLIQEDSYIVGNTWCKTIDFLHIDGDHTYEAVKRDISSFVPWVKVGGFVLFHDYGNNAVDYGVREAVDELTDKYFDKVEIISGMACCRRNNLHKKTQPLLQGGKVLLLGGAGYLGSVLSQYLQKQGDKVVIFDNFLYGKSTINADIRNINKLVPALEDADAVVNLAGLSNDPLANLKPELTWEINYKANEVIANLLKASGKRVIFASSCSVYGFSDSEEFSEESILQPRTLYARTKMLSEEVYLQKNIDSIILRFATIYGYSPSLRLDLVVNTMIGTSYFKKQIIVDGGKQWRPIVHVKDVAQAIYLALHASNHQYQIYNVGSNEQNYQISTLGELIQQQLPDVKLIINDSEIDKRSYKVNFNRIKEIGFQPQFTVNDAIKELYEKFKDGTVKSMDEDVYFRVKYLERIL